MPVDGRIESTIANFCLIYLGGIPPIITHDSAFLSFVCMLSATEALAGDRFAAAEQKPGKRFNEFVRTYYPAEYHPYALTDEQFKKGRLWFFRCRTIHGFSPAGFLLTHHHSENHLKIADGGNPILNAEDFYAAFLTAAQRYFADVRKEPRLQEFFLKRLDDREQGGPIGIGPVSLDGQF